MTNHAIFDHPFFAAPLRTIPTARAPVSCRTLGAGPAVLFIHGWPLHGATFRDVAVALSEDHTCHVIDLPGAGLSPGYDDWSDPLASHAATVLEVIDALQLDRVALIGHDSGGAIARVVAAELGERVSALVLGNTEITGHTARLVKLYGRLSRLPGSMRLLRRLMGSRRFRRSGYGFGGCFADRDRIDGEFFELFLAPLMADRATFAEQLGLLAHVDFDALADLGPVHARIHAPVRFIWGARDRFFPIEGARRMATELSGFERLVEIPEGKLFAHEEFPAVFADAAAELLRAAHGGARRLRTENTQRRRAT